MCSRGMPRVLMKSRMPSRTKDSTQPGFSILAAYYKGTVLCQPTTICGVKETNRSWAVTPLYFTAIRTHIIVVPNILCILVHSVVVSSVSFVASTGAPYSCMQHSNALLEASFPERRGSPAVLSSSRSPHRMKSFSRNCAKVRVSLRRLSCSQWIF